MKLSEMNVTEFVSVLGSDAPAPGGGSASSLVGSIGISLLKMVASLTVGREKYADHEALMKELMADAEGLTKRFLELMNNDTEAYNGVTNAFKMPKSTDEEKAKRSKVIQESLEESTLTPLAMMETAAKALEITKKAVGKSNTNASSDLGVAALTLKAAIQGAWLNVKINTPGLKNREFAEKCEKDGEKYLSKSLPLADEIYETVLASL